MLPMSLLCIAWKKQSNLCAALNLCLGCLCTNKSNFPVLFVPRNITGQPTTTKRTPVHQKWKRNVQQGGGAFIPCEWKVRCKGECLEEVENRLKLALAEMGNEGSGMSIEVYLLYLL